MKNIGLILVLLLVIGVGVGGAALINRQNSNKAMMSTKENMVASGKDTMMNKGTKAIDFELKDLDGKVHKLSDYNGKKVYVKFWASWCSICLAGLEDINTLSANNKDFEVITIVSPDFKGEKKSEDFKKWFSSLNYKNMVVLLDEKGSLAEKYGVRANPTSLAIGSDGILVKTMVGNKTNDEIKDVMKLIK